MVSCSSGLCYCLGGGDNPKVKLAVLGILFDKTSQLPLLTVLRMLCRCVLRAVAVEVKKKKERQKRLKEAGDLCFAIL